MSNIDSKPEEGERKEHKVPQNMIKIKLFVLVILCLQNSLFTVLRRYSQGVLNETYSSYEVLLAGEIVKIIFSAVIICKYSVPVQTSIASRLIYLVQKSHKMFALAIIYGLMNILSFIALRNIGAGTFTIIAQCKILTTASFSAIMLGRSYSWTKWRSLLQLIVGVLLFSVPTIEEQIGNGAGDDSRRSYGAAFLGILAVVTEVTLSGFASIYFEKVIKKDPEQLNIWERNFQLGLSSIPVYIAFILQSKGGQVGYGGGWSPTAVYLSFLGAGGGLLVALSIKHGDSVLKTLATSASIIISSVLDKVLLNGPLNFVMILGGINVILAICNYTFDQTPPITEVVSNELDKLAKNDIEQPNNGLISRISRTDSSNGFLSEQQQSSGVAEEMLSIAMNGGTAIKRNNIS